MSATTIVSTLLPIIGFINGVFMATSPAKAAKKIYKFDEKEIKPQVTNLVRANGASALRVAVLEIILSFTNTDYRKAVCIAMVPRVAFLLNHMVQRKEIGPMLRESKNVIKIVVATSLVDGRWVNSILSMQVRGAMYLFLGVLFTVAPNFVAKKSNQFDANPTTARCLRARGKMDIVFGTLVYLLPTMPYTQALGFACLAWFASSLFGDFIIRSRDRFRSDAYAQIGIAFISAGVLLTS